MRPWDLSRMSSSKKNLFPIKQQLPFSFSFRTSSISFLYGSSENRLVSCKFAPCELLTWHPVVLEIPNTAVRFLFRTLPVLRIPCKHQHSDACCGPPSFGIRVNCTVSRNKSFILPKVTVKVQKVTVIYHHIAQNGYSVTISEVQKGCAFNLNFFFRQLQWTLPKQYDLFYKCQWQTSDTIMWWATYYSQWMISLKGCMLLHVVHEGKLTS